MNLGVVDIAIMGLYFVAMLGIGVWSYRRASQNLDSYYLAGNSLPWYVLGVSNASAMFDIAGTMWLVSNVFIYGMKGIYLPWLWPTFNQVIMMVYLAAWVRRSNVLTGAEWMKTRFGGRGSEISRAMIAVFATVSVVLFVAYAFKGIGKFSKVFLPWDLSADTYALILVAITSVYVIMGGMISVVLTDLAQFVIMAVVSVAIGFIAMTTFSPADLDARVPQGWHDLTFGAHLELDWSQLVPAVDDTIAQQQYDGAGLTMWGAFFVMMVLKGIIVSVAGPAPNYDMQRILAAKSPREASLMSAVVSVALIPRWFMIAGIALIGVCALSDQFAATGITDFEMLLPYVMNEHIPPGLLGVMLAGLLSAFMSTFSATLNAGTAYIVNDVYKRYVRPGLPDRHYIKVGYVVPVFILGTGMLISMGSKDVNAITQVIVNGLFGGYAAANVLKWHWWRFNGYGYFWGMLAGLASATLNEVLRTQGALGALGEVHVLWSFVPCILLPSLLASIAATLLTPAEDDDTLEFFYRQVRPWGFWRPVVASLLAKDPDFRPNRSWATDATNVAVGIVWQLTMVAGPTYLIFGKYREMLISIAVFGLTSAYLKRFWYDTLESREPEPVTADDRPA